MSWRRQWHPTPVLSPGKSHGQRSLVGCSPWGRWESDMTEWLHFHFSLSCIGEGNGNWLQCSCLENPRDGGAWWAAVYGVTQSQTRLKRLSSSSSKVCPGIEWLVGFSGGSDGKESAHNLGDPGSIPGWEDSLEKGMATYSSILAWRIPWTEDGIQSTGWQRVRPAWAANTFTFRWLVRERLLCTGKETWIRIEEFQMTLTGISSYLCLLPHLESEDVRQWFIIPSRLIAMAISCRAHLEVKIFAVCTSNAMGSFLSLSQPQCSHL